MAARRICWRLLHSKCRVVMCATRLLWISRAGYLDCHAGYCFWGFARISRARFAVQSRSLSQQSTIWLEKALMLLPSLDIEYSMHHWLHSRTAHSGLLTTYTALAVIPLCCAAGTSPTAQMWSSLTPWGWVERWHPQSLCLWAGSTTSMSSHYLI